MATVNADYINPFLLASTKVLKDMVMLDAKLGKPYINNDLSFKDDSLLIMLGVTGEMKGQVILCFKKEIALDIASKMCMMPITEMSELAQSAICELCNMILGNAATVFSTKGILIDITPPTTCQGNVSFSTDYAANICVPVVYEDDKTIEINVSIKG
ncbi:MAG: chemotaxis protein CheX [Lachnospiraceae bacterium]|nr:chemotaxis protein CheX [Lachnospiraceae bacterium]